MLFTHTRIWVPCCFILLGKTLEWFRLNNFKERITVFIIWKANIAEHKTSSYLSIRNSVVAVLTLIVKKCFNGTMQDNNAGKSLLLGSFYSSQFCHTFSKLIPFQQYNMWL